MTQPADTLVGQILGDCQIVSRIGAGAMGVVYRARHARHGDVCAKVIAPDFQARGDMLRRFAREAEAARRLQHPHVVRGFGLEEVDGYQLLLQELVAGGDLEAYLKSSGGKLPVPEALRIAQEVALGLAAAHAAGLVHRDLKPGNVLLDAERRVKVADLGLVLQVDGEPLDGRTILTKKGSALGTPYYMSPEQWAGAHDVDARTDLYALGIMLHQLISGQTPLSGHSVSALMRSHMQDPPLPLRSHEPTAPEAVEVLILRLLAKNRDERPPSATSVAKHLEGLLAQYGGMGATLVGAGAIETDPLVGKRLGDVEITGKLGEGAMGVVYRARHPEFGEVCAKVVAPEHQAEGDMLRRFRREAEAACRIRHPHVVRGFGFLEADGHHLLLQELVSGGDLDGHLKRYSGQLNVGEALRICREVALGLAAAHDAGMIHRDLKPGNVLLAPGETEGALPTAKLADLGLVLQVDGEPLDGKTVLTKKGSALGTPYYMSPEQWTGAHDVDARTDLYALGVMLHQLVSGKLPIKGKNISAIMKSHLQGAPIPIRSHAPETPAPVEALILSLLQKDPEARPATAGAVAGEIARIGAELGIANSVVAGAPIDVTVADASAVAPPNKADATDDDDPLIGATIGGKLKVTAVLGKGGMGVVYKARHTLLDSDFAVKVIHKSFAENTEFRSRFLREAKALLAFVHEGATSLRDFGEHEGSLYMALDFAHGDTLGQMIKRDGALPEARVVKIAEQVVSCLEKAHEAGLVHRDLKPANLIVGYDGRVRVLDFGIAKILSDAKEMAGTEENTLTGTGVSIGTPHYMSPEQDAGDPVDARTDIYSLGCVLYEAVTGQKPIQAETTQKLHFKIQFEEPPTLHEVSGGAVSKTFSDAVAWSLKKKRDERPETARTLLDALSGAAAAPAVEPKAFEDEAAAPSAEPTRKGGVGIVIGLLLLLVLGAGGVGAWQAGLLGPGAGDGAEPGGTATAGGDGGTSGGGEGGTPAAGTLGKVTVTEPVDGLVTRERTITVSGTVNDPGLKVLWLDATLIPVRDGAFSEPVELTPGTHQVKIAADEGGPALTTLTINVDDTPPGIKIDAPTAGEVTNASEVIVRGQAQDRFLARVTADGKDLGAASDGGFEGKVAVPGADGEATIELEAVDEAGNVHQESVSVVVDRTPPSVATTDPATGSVTSRDSLTLRVTVKDDHPGTVRVDRKPMKKLPDGAYEVTLTLPSDGDHVFKVVATDAAGNEGAEHPVTLRRDSTPLVVEIIEPVDGLVTSAGQVTVKGKIGGKRPIKSLSVGAGVATAAPDRTFETTVILPREGAIPIEIKVADDAGSGSSKTVTVTRDGTGPSLKLDAAPSPLTRAGTVRITGRVSDANPKAVRVRVGADDREVPVDAQGRFSTDVTLADGANRVRLTPLDAAGNAPAAGGEVDETITRDSAPPKIAIGVRGPKILTNQRSYRFDGKLEDAHPAKVWIEGNPEIATAGDGSFQLTAVALSEGSNTVRILGADAAGNAAAPVVYTVTLDASAPTLSVDPVPAETEDKSITVRGKVSDDSGAVELTIGGRKISPAGDGRFTHTWTLKNGANRLDVVARDAAGNAAPTKTLRVELAAAVGTIESINARWGLVVIKLVPGQTVTVNEELRVVRGDSTVGRVQVAKLMEGGQASAAPVGGGSADALRVGDELQRR